MNVKKAYLLLSIIFVILLNCSKKTENNIQDIEKDINENQFTRNEIIEKDIVVAKTGFSEALKYETEIKYNNGNGTIVDYKMINGKNWIIIKHETENKQISWQSFSAYDNLDEKNGNILFELSDRMIVSTLEIAYAEERESNFELWIKVKNDQRMIGWIKTDGYYDPYHDDTWMILDTIEIEEKSLTVRKLEQGLESTTRLNVRDKPSLMGNVIFQLNPGTFIQTIAIIEEAEIIDGINDHWVKIIDENEKIGWIFGGYTDVQRGGPKFNTPKNRVGISIAPP
jgi:hypothetical protein